MAFPSAKALAALALVFLMFPWAAAVPGAPWGEPALRREIRFALGSFDPLSDPLPEGAALGSRLAPGPFVVQFEGRAGSAQARAVEDAGGAVAAVLGADAFVVAGPAGLAIALDRMLGVRWVGAVPPLFRMHPASGSAEFLSVSYSGGAQELLTALAPTGASAVVVGGSFAIVRPGWAGASALAALPDVLFVAPYTPPSPDNYRAVLTDRIRQVANASAYTPSGGALWAFNGNPAAPRFVGYTGEGVRVDVTDEGVDGTHPAFAGRLGTATSWSGVPAWQDLSGHGTHVAATVLGSGAYVAADGPGLPGLYAGAAPGATLVAQNYNAAAMNISLMADFAATAGATISVNSWGDGDSAARGAYTAEAAAYDAMAADASSSTAGAQPVLFVFAAGNEDNAPGSINSPGTAKNVLTVGAVGNDYPGLTTSDAVALFSAFGPTDDGRLKPEIVAPGEMVASARSTMGPSGTGIQPAYAGTSYVYKNGTSMATPQVGGAAAVATQYLRDARAVLATPPLLKALLLNGAQPLPGLPWPSPAQGFGRLDLAASLLGSATTRVDFVEEDALNRSFTDDGIFDYFQFPVALDAGETFRVTLAWTDPANSPLAPAALWNDLDLEVRDPTDSLIFEGNRVDASTGYSTPGASAHFDGTNNTETVRIQAAAAGTWSIFVRSYRFVSQMQTFALAYSGAINRSEPDLAVEAIALAGAPARIESGDLVEIDGDVLNRGGTSAPSVVVEARDANDALASPYAAFSAGTLGPGARAAFTLRFPPPDGDNDVEVRARFNGTDADASNDAATVAFFVARFQPQLGGSADTTALPGEAALFALAITNTGNMPDTFALSEDAGLRDPRWALSLSRASVPLGPGESAAFNVTIEVPPSSAIGDFTLAEIWAASAGNASRRDSFSLTAHAGAAHALSLVPGSPSFLAEPGADAEFIVAVTNLGNGPEEVQVTATGEWPGASERWNFTGETAVVARGVARNFTLVLGNADSAAAGYRGAMRIRAEVTATGAVFETLVPVVMSAAPCLAFDPVPALTTLGATPTSVPLALRNCGNVALQGRFSVETGSGYAVGGPTDFDLVPGNTAFADASLTAEDGLLDGNYTVRLFAETAGGLAAYTLLTTHHRTAVLLDDAGSLPDVEFGPADRFASATLAFHNRGGAGPVAAPRVRGLPPGWRASVFPDSLWAAQGASVAFTLTVDRQDDLVPRTLALTLSFYADSPREGAFAPPVEVVGRAPPAPVSNNPGASPSSLLGALAVAFGAAAALALAAFVRNVQGPRSALPRTCPSCGQKAPRFDTLLNPLCSRCGEGLQKEPQHT